jgi:hypothetical protein
MITPPPSSVHPMAKTPASATQSQVGSARQPLGSESQTCVPTGHCAVQYCDELQYIGAGSAKFEPQKKLPVPPEEEVELLVDPPPLVVEVELQGKQHSVAGVSPQP